ncbi:gamma-glutamyl-gamma-aminobutyrate hydrolase family protein [Salinibacterium sp. NG253]|uniref:gamma-glutamyl-gamma-aminobutyrate hydrolase family protein n=1 Tax=Salinibacterium sp. NG253 TaxID=2792039 RepID=UPI0018CFEAEE|nr:gamma-glutamyl-gamma-aminobutyrate hydrolase family protein [Salinibacterium sp. NG253]MBH0117300.1 gamma-glutamyl-gamma-aminobutyrate hydrolase family protein [Salinibacterium sp. NG253]
MTTTPEYVPTIVLSKASAGGAHEKPELTALIHGLEASMKSAIEATGARVISVDGFTDADVDAALSQADGVVLLGGGDVDPDEYGATERHPKLYNIDRTTDRVDIELVNQATERRLPLLAICRGMHIVNVARGGTLIQHLEPSAVVHSGGGVDAMVDHDVTLEPASQLSELYGDGTMTIRSGHHQAVDVVGAGLTATGRAADGVVEAVESTDPTSPLIAVQWHPEDDKASERDRELLFGWLTAQAREFHTVRASAAV